LSHIDEDGSVRGVWVVKSTRAKRTGEAKS
jgi:hypothetical protein